MTWTTTSPSEPPLVTLILEYFDGGDWPGARRIWQEAELENDERAEYFGHFDSMQRAYLKNADRLYLIEDNWWV